MTNTTTPPLDDLARPCIRLLYRRRYVVLAAGALAFILSAARVFLWLHESYVAEVALVATLGGQGAVAGDLAPEALDSKVYEQVVSCLPVLYETYDRFRESGSLPESDEIPSFDSFVNLLSASVSPIDQTTRPVTFSPLIRLQANYDNPETARALVDIWADVAMEAARKTNYVQYGQLAAQLGDQAQSRKARLHAVWQELEEEHAVFDVAAKRKELSLLLAESALLVKELALAERAAAAAAAKAARIQQTLAAEQPLTELIRRPSGGSDILQPDSKGMPSQELNQTYWSLRKDENAAAAEIAAAEARVEKTRSQILLADSRKTTLAAEIARHDVAQQSLKVEEELASAAYKEVSAAQALLAETASLIQGTEGAESYPAGLNRLSDVIAVERTLSVTTLLFIPAYTFLAMCAAAACIVAPLFGHRITVLTGA